MVIKLQTVVPQTSQSCLNVNLQSQYFKKKSSINGTVMFIDKYNFDKHYIKTSNFSVINFNSLYFQSWMNLPR